MEPHFLHWKSKDVAAEAETLIRVIMQVDICVGRLMQKFPESSTWASLKPHWCLKPLSCLFSSITMPVGNMNNFMIIRGTKSRGNFSCFYCLEGTSFVLSSQHFSYSVCSSHAPISKSPAIMESFRFSSEMLLLFVPTYNFAGLFQEHLMALLPILNSSAENHKEWEKGLVEHLYKNERKDL